MASALNLPDDVQRWMDVRIAEGGYRDESDYLAMLLRRDRDEEEKLARLREALEEGRNSPLVDPSIEDIIAGGRAGLRRVEASPAVGAGA